MNMDIYCFVCGFYQRKMHLKFIMKYTLTNGCLPVCACGGVYVPVLDSQHTRAFHFLPAGECWWRCGSDRSSRRTLDQNNCMPDAHTSFHFSCQLLVRCRMPTPTACVCVCVCVCVWVCMKSEICFHAVLLKADFASCEPSCPFG